MQYGRPWPEGRTPRCVFRIAAGPHIGFGHLMRARALARSLGVRPVVSIRGGAIARATALRVGCLVVPAHVDPLAGSEVLVVDDPSPRQVAAWVSRARRRGLRSVAVQDGVPDAVAADLAVDGSICAPVRSARGRRLTGPRFYILDMPDNRCPPVAPGRAGHDRPRVLIALGGGTHVRRVAAHLVAAIARRCPTADIAVASGFATTPPPPLPHGRWIAGGAGLAPSLAWCDVAVVAGGVTLYEACARRVPLVGVAVVMPQRAALRAFAAAGAIVDGGGPGVTARSAARVGDGVRHLLRDDALRARVAARAGRLVDGAGASRIAARIQAMAVPAAVSAGRLTHA